LLEQVGVLVNMLMELVGLESWTGYNTIISILVITTIHDICKDGVSNKQKLFSKVVSGGKIWLWILSFLFFTPGSDLKHPSFALLALAFQFGVIAIEVLFAEFNDYSHSPKANVVDKVADAIKKILELESIVLLLVAVFGYPSFTSADVVTQYYCLVPVVPLYMIYNAQVKPHCDTGDSVDAAAAANGEVVKETDPEPAADLSSDESVKEKVAKIEESVNDGDGSSVENINEEKVEAMIKRIQNCITGVYTAVGSRVLTIISPVCNLVAKLVNMISSLPWSCITMTITSNLSLILLTTAWLTITSNILSYCIPVITILLPLIISKISAADCYRPYISELSSLALSGVQFCLISGVTISLGAEE